MTSTSLVHALNDIWAQLELPRAEEARAANLHQIDFADPSVNGGYLPPVVFAGPKSSTCDGGARVPTVSLSLGLALEEASILH